MINTPRNGPRKAPFSISSPQSGCQSLDISLGYKNEYNEHQHGSLKERKPSPTTAVSSFLADTTDSHEPGARSKNL